jgi:hypothetical protein
MSFQFREMSPSRLAGLEKDALMAVDLEASDPPFALMHKSNVARSLDSTTLSVPSVVVDPSVEASGSAASDVGHGLSECDREVLVKTMLMEFRWHPHVNNVLTHICGSQWTKVEQALRAIVNPATMRGDLSPLARNLVELMWAERGVTGRILKPYLREFLARDLSLDAADQVLFQVSRLCPVSEI